MQFGSGFWKRKKAFRNGLNGENPSKLKVVCYRCHRHCGGHRSEPRIREQTVMIIGGESEYASEAEESRA